MPKPSAPTPARSLRIEQIGALVVVPPGPLRGASMRAVETIPNASLLIRDGRIAWFGPAAAAPLDEGVQVLSAEGGCVIPGLIDCHTHIPFAGTRSAEFVRRLQGESYLSILESGGGIRVTMESVRSIGLDALIADNLPRLQRLLTHGVTTAECKSGYGLRPEDEWKQLEAIRALDEAQPIALIPTYLGAHAVPPEFDRRPSDYLEQIADPAFLGRIAAARLARFCDVFCDRGAFDVAQARLVLERARVAGLGLKLHADELAQIGATRLAGELGALSADHLEQIDAGGIAALRAAGVVAVALPGTSFFLGIPHVDARALIEAGLAVAIGSDLNPGSSHIESLPLVLNIACCQLRLLPVEALVAATANAAAALDLQTRLGAIHAGFEADLVLLDTPSIDEWLYRVGRPGVSVVIKAGRIVYRRAHEA
jgi:imidazolonepropionase